MKNCTPKYVFLIFLIPATILWGQNTYVPDDNFEQVLIDLGYDDTLDDYVLTENISGVTSLDVSAATSLAALWCDGNQLTSPIGEPPGFPYVT